MIQRDHDVDETAVRLVTAEAEPAEPARQFENVLRPTRFAEYIGQQQIKDTLFIAMDAAKKRSEPLEHILLHGSPGLGKTTLATVITNEMNVGLRVTSGPAIEKQGDLASLLTNLKENDVLFIDEIHRLRPVVEELLYAAMEDYALDIMIGKGVSARSMRLNLPRFTLIGATTKASLLSSPLRARFGHVFKFEFYTLEELGEIVQRSAKLLNCELERDACELIAKSSRATPRIANRLLRRVRDMAAVRDNVRISAPLVSETLELLGIDPLGLDRTDRELLRTIIEKFHGGPVGLSTLAAALSEEQETLEDMYEPYLLQLGLLERTHRGRIATRRAAEHLHLPSPFLS